MSTPQSPALDGGTGRMSGRAWAVLFVLCGAIFLEGIDVAMLNVALPSIRSDLGMTTGAVSWVMSAYVLGYGGFMLLGGRTADLLGRRRMFLFWLVVFLAFSGLGGVASEGWVLIVARFVTGVAAAFMAPAGLAIITTGFAEGRQRNKALLVYAGTAAAGFSLGLVVGGLLTAINWRWVFFAPVIMASVILLAALFLIPAESRPARSSQGFDLAGAASVTGAMLLLVFAVVSLEDPGAGWGRAAAALAGGLALLAAFVAIERRSAAPLVRLGMLRSGPLVRANLGAMLFAGSFFGFQFIAVFYLQELRGWSSLETSLALLAVGVDAVLAPTVTPRLVSRFGNVRVIFGGMLLAAAAYALFLPMGLDWTYAAMFPTMIMLGLAFALAYGPLTIAATDGVAEEEQGLAGGLLYTSFQFGSALGLSAVTAVNAAAAGAGGSPEAGLDGFRAALIVPLVAVVLGAAVTASGLGRRRTTAAGAPREALEVAEASR
ncbi:Major Facilitator Superfamily protein [Streptosporangium canum]|uniref:Major Facilitator Superfamily protein n=1 Tax=Streptosporangium canum TaxID=324952 RepID=A0A1I3WHB4_9ACTN|nr:MFS transporter [Streptosporangium canum]SFK05831.1 Major Facilitator Superfamily protein [Streptosporangium canum]